MSLPKGYKHSPETRLKISSGLRSAYTLSPRPKGAVRSEETRMKMSASMRLAIAEGRHPGSASHLRQWQTKDRLASLGGTVASALSRGLTKERRALRHRLGVYVQSARRRGFSWELTEVFFESIVTKECWYCGAAPSQEQKKWPGVRFNGLDRVENDRGYVEDNVVPCCVRCNYGKHTMGRAEFLDMVKRIAARHANANTCP